MTKRRVVIGEHTVDMRKATPKPDKMAGGGGAGGWGPQGMGFGGPGKPQELLVRYSFHRDLKYHLGLLLTTLYVL